MKKLTLAQSLIGLGLVGACSAGGTGVGGSGLRGAIDETGGGSAVSGGAGGTGGRLTGSGGANSVITGGMPNLGAGGTGKTGGTVSGTGGGSTGGATAKTGGTTSAGGTATTGGATGSGGSTAAGGSSATGGTSSGGTGGASGGTGGSSATGGASSGGTSATGGTSSGGTGGNGTGGGSGVSNNGLIGHWLFDEASGTTAADATAMNNTLTLAGSAGCSTLGAAGKSGKRLTLGKGSPLYNDCNGTASKANVSNLGTLNTATVALWMKNESGSATYGYAAGLFEFGDISILWDATELYGAAGMGEAITPAPTDNAWHHVAITWNTGNGEIHVFLDGGEVEIGYNATTPLSGAHPLFIGKTQGETRGFSGGIDDVRLYNRVLTAPEITALAQ